MLASAEFLLQNPSASPSTPPLLQHRNSLQHLLELCRALRRPAKAIKVINQHLRVRLSAVRP